MFKFFTSRLQSAGRTNFAVDTLTELDKAEIATVAGGLNPQPLPPVREMSLRLVQ